MASIPKLFAGGFTIFVIIEHVLVAMVTIDRGFHYATDKAESRDALGLLVWGALTLLFGCLGFLCAVRILRSVGFSNRKAFDLAITAQAFVPMTTFVSCAIPAMMVFAGIVTSDLAFVLLATPFVLGGVLVPFVLVILTAGCGDRDGTQLPSS